LYYNSKPRAYQGGGGMHSHQLK